MVAEIGSTTTVVSAFHGLDSKAPRLLGQGLGRTTVEEGDVNLGLQKALEQLEQHLGCALSWELFFASSSAAGGLRMSVHGLVYQMTARAAREAALGAGAVVKQITAGVISETDLHSLEEARPNIVLLAGGVDFGEQETVLKNAALLLDWFRKKNIDIPVIFCGNSAAAKAVTRIFEQSHRSIIVTDNVYPQIDRLNIQPARRAIQQLFNRHIVEARGMEQIRKLVNGEIMPTPGAVMEAAVLAAVHLPDLLTFDVGGATTDIYSVTKGDEEVQRLAVHPEPEAKRTVEGDLGVYRNAGYVAGLEGVDTLREAFGTDYESLLTPLPETEGQIALARVLAGRALRTALLRHVGRWRHLYGPAGRQTVVEGKDLTRVKWIIGTGGALVRLPAGEALMKKALLPETGEELLPKGGLKFLLDRRYIMAAAGVMARRFPDAAWALLKESIGA